MADRQVDQSLLTQLLNLPSEQYFADRLTDVNPQAVRDVRDFALRQLAKNNREQLLLRYQGCVSTSTEYSLDPLEVGRRSLANFALLLLLRLDDEFSTLCLQQYLSASNMTDRLAAFSSLVDSTVPERREVIADFYQQWQQHPLLVDKWFSIQVLSHRKDVFSSVEKLLNHPDFSLTNPNRVRALLGAFCQNTAVFHRADGSGYRLLVDKIIELDQRNPQIAARLAAPLTRWKRLEPQRRELLRLELVRLQQLELSRDLNEIVCKSLA